MYILLFLIVIFCQCTNSVVRLPSRIFTSHSSRSRCCSNSNDSETLPVNLTWNHDPSWTGWFSFVDPKDSFYQKLALNFSWKPSNDSFTTVFQGFNLKVQKRRVRKTATLCLNHHLNSFKHSSTYYYNSFGFSDNLKISPGDKWNINVKGISCFNKVDPRELSRSIKIPDCSDSRMKNVYKCHQLSLFDAHVRNPSCRNHSITYLYNVPPMLGSSATVLLWYKKPGGNDVTDIEKREFLKLNDSLIISVPLEHYNFTYKYFIRVSGNIKRIHVKTLSFNFSSCISISHEPISEVISPVVISIGFMFAIVIYIVCFYKKDVNSLFFRRLDQVTQQSHDEQLLLNEISKIKQVVTIYIVFVNDHPFHKEIVSLLASFLSHDLGFNVVSELYQTNEICQDLVGCIEKTLSNADRVIVIWSPKAFKRWELREKQVAINDTFTPVVKQIDKDLFLEKNSWKYFFAYFDYCLEKNIPSELIDKHQLTPFKLMDQIEMLYFRLKGIEMYAPGSVVKPEKLDLQNYHLSASTTYGSGLHKKLNKMSRYVKEKPLWFEEKHNVPVIANADSALPDKDIVNYEIKRNSLNVIPPPSIPNCASYAQAESESSNKIYDSAKLNSLSSALQQKLNDPVAASIDVKVSLSNQLTHQLKDVSKVCSLTSSEKASVELNSNRLILNNSKIIFSGQCMAEVLAKKLLITSEQSVVFNKPVIKDAVCIDGGNDSIENPASTNITKCNETVISKTDDVSPIVPIDFKNDSMQSLMQINQTCNVFL